MIVIFLRVQEMEYLAKLDTVEFLIIFCWKSPTIPSRYLCHNGYTVFKACVSQINLPMIRMILAKLMRFVNWNPQFVSTVCCELSLTDYFSGTLTSVNGF